MWRRVKRKKESIVKDLVRTSWIDICACNSISIYARPHTHDRTSAPSLIFDLIIGEWVSQKRTSTQFSYIVKVKAKNQENSTRREFLREILYKNIAITAIQHGKFILLAPLAIFPILLGEIHSSPSGKFPYTY